MSLRSELGTRLGAAKLSRDTILFFSGLVGVFREAERSGIERPTLLIIYAGMLGLPIFARLDEKRQAAKDVAAVPEKPEEP